jgi:hypothetical protein
VKSVRPSEERLEGGMSVSASVEAED